MGARPEGSQAPALPGAASGLSLLPDALSDPRCWDSAPASGRRGRGLSEGRAACSAQHSAAQPIRPCPRSQLHRGPDSGHHHHGGKAGGAVPARQAPERARAPFTRGSAAGLPAGHRARARARAGGLQGRAPS